MIQIINRRGKNYHLRNKGSPKACCTGRINTIIHVSAQSTTNNNVKWITNSLKKYKQMLQYFIKLFLKNVLMMKVH